MELNFEYSLLQKKYDHALRMIKELEKANAELNIEIKRLYACRNELQEVTAAADDPAINTICSLAEWVSGVSNQNKYALAARDEALDEIERLHAKVNYLQSKIDTFCPNEIAQEQINK